jgi:hypothetical protein
MSDFNGEIEAWEKGDAERTAQRRIAEAQAFKKFTQDVTSFIGEDAIQQFKMKFVRLRDGRPGALGEAFGHWVIITIPDKPGHEGYYMFSHGEPLEFKPYLEGDELRPLLVEVYGKARNCDGRDLPVRVAKYDARGSNGESEGGTQ